MIQIIERGRWTLNNLPAEIDYLLRINDQGVKTYENSQANNNIIAEWLSTKMGSVWGNPYWGCNLNEFRHQPHSRSTAICIENAILLKISSDLPQLPVSAIQVTPSEMDIYIVKISTRYGLISESVKI